MTLNPYEAPQTIDTPPPLPVAEAVNPFMRTREGLIRAAALCMEGGRYQAVAGLAGMVMILLALWKVDPSAERQLEKLLILIAFAVAVVLWAWGAIKNFRGYTGMANYVTDDDQRNLYTTCQIQWWFQLFLVVLMLFLLPDSRRSNVLLPLVFYGLLILCYFHSVLLQFHALRSWNARLELRFAARRNFAGGVAVVSCACLELLLPLLGFRDNLALHLVLAFLLAVTAFDFGQHYRVIKEALASRD